MLRQPLEGRAGADLPGRRLGDLSQPVHAGVRHEPLQVRLVRPPQRPLPLHGAGGAALSLPACPAPFWTASTCLWRWPPWSSVSWPAAPRRSPPPVIKGRVDRARDIQRGRYGDASCNARMGQQELDRFCALDSECQRLMQGAFDRMGLTARSYDRILRVARTIADLDSSTSIQLPHLAEALQYRPPEYLRR